MRLSHLHLPGLITYSRSLQLQDALLERQFAYKTYIRKSTPASSREAAATGSSSFASSPEPNPTLLTFQTHPTYTVGRRHLNSNPLSPAQIAFLTSNAGNLDSLQKPNLAVNNKAQQLATFYPSPRGGLLTYHAPGQLTAYLVLNLRAHKLTPRCYIRTLENTVIRTCARHGLPNTGTTADPGVWVTTQPNWKVINKHDPSEAFSCQPTGDDPASDVGSDWSSLRPTDRKICAVGVQVSRGITSHGIGLNVVDAPIAAGSTDDRLYTMPAASDFANQSASAPDRYKYTRTTTQLDHYNSESFPTSAQQLQQQRQAAVDVPAPGYLSWGFSRIVACGLEGKSVTWLSREQQDQSDLSHTGQRDRRAPLTVDAVAQSLAVELCRSLELDERDIQNLSEEDILAV